MSKNFSRLKGGLIELSIRRPLLIIVINLLILLAGIGSLLGIDVRELPDVDRPIVGVRAVYDGASPETMDAEVTSVLEGAIARVSGVKNIESSSEENNSRINVEFQPGSDINAAASDVREAVSQIEQELPPGIDQVIVLKADEDAEPVIELSAYSTTLSSFELAERIDKDIAPEFLSISGVADVRLNGNQPRVMRVLLDPAKLAGYKLSVTIVLDALRSIDLDVPAGSYRSIDQDLLVRAEASLVEPEAVEQLYIRDNIQVKDIGTVFYAPQQAETYALLNGRVVVGLGIVRQAGSNTIAIAAEVDKRLQAFNERSQDVTLVKTADNAVYIKGALKDVVYSLLFAVIVVLLVIALFLGQWRAVLIPAVTMPISLVGTLAAIWLFGFSLNLLTLLALVLATGLIVDDAIVVLENIQRRRSAGLEKMAAAVLGTRQVFFAVVATTITLISVFLPISFLPGETGGLFREFGLVLAIAVCISSFVAVTLCPMMASRLPNLSKPSPFIQSIQDKLQAFGTSFASFYFRTLKAVLLYRKTGVIIAVIIAILGSIGFTQLNKELLPQEDRGQLVVFLTGPDGASLNYADRQAQQIEAVLQPYQQQGIITDIFSLIGRYDKNRALIISTMASWDQRSITQMELAEELNKKLSDFPGATVRIVQRSSLSGRQGGSGLELVILGNDYNKIYREATRFGRLLKERVPAVKDVNIQFDTSQPEIAFNINRQQANDLSVPLDQISDTLRVMTDRLNLLDLSVDDQAIPVMVGSADGVINDPGDLLNVLTVNTAGALVPLSAMVSIEERGIAAQLDRFAQRRAIKVDIGVPPGTALGEVTTQIQQLAQIELPQDISMEFLGEAATLEESSADTAITFLIALLVVFLVLTAQFESIGSALIVMFTVPFGLAAAVFALLLSGQTINLYSQIGLVMLVGLMTKNAILLVEFMDQLRDEGYSVPDAIMEAVKVRLRPVVMTVLSTVLGSIPLILSTGPGAEARNAIGWVVFGGLGLSTLFTLYLAPLGYALIAPYLKRRAHTGEVLEQQLAQAAKQEPA